MFQVIKLGSEINVVRWIVILTFIVAILTVSVYSRSKKNANRTTVTTPKNRHVKKICRQLGETVRARHKVCFLRPDTGPCRADIVQWYFDVKENKCYRFFWGGCQGNGNKFETQKECHHHCLLNSTEISSLIPHFCSLTFDYGSCFGHFYRWGWDNFSKTCRRRLYSGCGGNQNNFESKKQCLASCLTAPRNTLQKSHTLFTCVPFHYDDM